MSLLLAIAWFTGSVMCVPGANAQETGSDASAKPSITREEAAAAPAKAEDPDKKESPWLILPTISADPKLGFSIGAMAAYLYYFDEQSRVSMFAATAQYTSTGSAVGAIFAKTSFRADHHRVLALAAGGLIKNDYDDFLGTGQPLKTEDNLYAVVGRYHYRVKGNWFVGGQALYTNYQMIGQSALDDQILNILGLTGFKSGGIGAMVQHDSRDSDNSPTKGWVLDVNNIAYRDWLAGDENFDVYKMDLKGFWSHGGGHVFAVHQNNQWTADAPPSAYASVKLRGYKMGQYLGKYMSAFEVEERLRLAKNWGATLFAGVACLYGGDKSCSDSTNLYPAFGAGIQYIVKQKEGMVANLEYAQGKPDNYGIYLKLGYGF